MPSLLSSGVGGAFLATICLLLPGQDDIIHHDCTQPFPRPDNSDNRGNRETIECSKYFTTYFIQDSGFSKGPTSLNDLQALVQPTYLRTIDIERMTNPLTIVPTQVSSSFSSSPSPSSSCFLPSFSSQPPLFAKVFLGNVFCIPIEYRSNLSSSVVLIYFKSHQLLSRSISASQIAQVSLPCYHLACSKSFCSLLG